MNVGANPSGQRKIRQLNDRRILFDWEDFFEDPDDWSEEAARSLAAEAGLSELSDEHWRVMHFLRDYYQRNGRAPLNKHLTSGLGMSISRIQALFPGGIKYGARRLAGLPNPKSCM